MVGLGRPLQVRTRAISTGGNRTQDLSGLVCLGPIPHTTGLQDYPNSSGRVPNSSIRLTSVGGLWGPASFAGRWRRMAVNGLRLASTRGPVSHP